MAAKTQFGDDAEVAATPGKTMFGDNAEDAVRNPAASATYAPPVGKPELPPLLRTGTDDYVNAHGIHMPGPDSPIMGSPVMPLAAGSIGPIRMLVSALGAMGGDKAAGSVAQHFNAPPIVENGARFAGGTLGGLMGGAVGESPAIKGAVKGAFKGIPAAVASHPQLAKVMGYGGGVSIPHLLLTGHPELAAAGAGISASPFMAMGARAGAAGKPLLGPGMRSIFPEPTPINRSPQWAGIEPNPVQASEFSPMEGASLPSGRTIGGEHNVPLPAQPITPTPRRPLWADFPEPSTIRPQPFSPIPATATPSGRPVNFGDNTHEDFSHPLQRSIDLARSGELKPPESIAPAPVSSSAEGPPTFSNGRIKVNVRRR